MKLWRKTASHKTCHLIWNPITGPLKYWMKIRMILNSKVSPSTITEGGPYLIYTHLLIQILGKRIWMTSMYQNCYLRTWK
jgi:hypothetical protein